ncbi:hypothetical protein PcPA57_14570 [Pasteurella canis]|nr:hypothetical protein PcPA57_14570 [Pasteurella canis]
MSKLKKYQKYWVARAWTKKSRKKMSNNAKLNRQLNHGCTAATYFYVSWGY